MTDAELIEKVEQLWAAARITEYTDALRGEVRYTEMEFEGRRVSVVEWLDAQAHHKAEGIQSHPIDKYITAERERAQKLWRPGPEQWWTNRDAGKQGGVAWAISRALEAIRQGFRPKEAIKMAQQWSDLTASHHLDEIELRTYHFCRLAGLCF